MTRFAVSLFALATILSTSSTGCFLYFDDDDDCEFDFGNADRLPELGRRNPISGQCEFRGGGGPFPCDGTCGPCPEADFEAPLEDDPSANWAFCPNECNGLDEATCLDTPACRGIYNANLGFEECWGTDLSGPIQGGGCEQLDAIECSMHDDCIAIHEAPCSVDQAGAEAPSCELGQFIACGDEENSDPGTCYGEVECDSLPPECPPDTMPGIRNGCWSGFCIPIDECESQPECTDVTEEFSCIARGDCAPQYRGIDCTCDDNGCVCADHEFAGCEDGV